MLHPWEYSFPCHHAVLQGFYRVPIKIASGGCTLVGNPPLAVLRPGYPFRHLRGPPRATPLYKCRYIVNTRGFGCGSKTSAQ